MTLKAGYTAVISLKNKGNIVNAHQQKFIEFARQHQVLRFGQFQLKSGRTSPYFFNAGLFKTGKALAQLGQFYAQTLVDAGLSFDVLFGPAYKGIPLVSATAIALAEHQKDIPYCFNRKEAKNHGEGGQLVGADLSGDVLIVDDVITAGTAIREAIDIIKAHGGNPVGVIIALDRQERGQQQQSAIQEIEQQLGLTVLSIIKLNDLIDYLQQDPKQQKLLKQVQTYQQRYGIGA